MYQNGKHRDLSHNGKHNEWSYNAKHNGKHSEWSYNAKHNGKHSEWSYNAKHNGKHSNLSHNGKPSKCSKCNYDKYEEQDMIDDIILCDYNYRELGEGSGKNFTRLCPSAYSDGISDPAGQNRPSARVISNEIFDQKHSIPNEYCVNSWFWLWGQAIDHDITRTKTTDEQFNIHIPECDMYFDPECTGNKVIHFHRSNYDPETSKPGTPGTPGTPDIPREQVNELSPYIDASMIYGTDKARNDYLRKHECGLLKTSTGGMMPMNDGYIDNANEGHTHGALFVGGDVRANEHFGLITIHTLFVREHNYWATRIKERYPCLDDETIYQRAKIIVESEIQAITFNEFLSTLLGCDGFEPYKGYNENVKSCITNMFAAAAFRFGHTAIPSKLYDGYDLKETYFVPHLMCNDMEISQVVKDYLCTPAENIDAKVVTDLRNFLFGNPGEGGFDLAALYLV